ncbi:MAG TPA: hypothetical protein VIZ58_08365 [Thermoanaerobaculia bacterium]
MTKKPSKPKTRPGKGRKLRVKKETIKDLSAKDGAARGVKGGMIPASGAVSFCQAPCVRG